MMIMLNHGDVCIEYFIDEHHEEFVFSRGHLLLLLFCFLALRLCCFRGLGADDENV